MLATYSNTNHTTTKKAVVNKRRKRVKETLSVVAFLLCFCCTYSMANYTETHYKINGTVISVNGENVVVEDTTGNIWEFEADGLIKGEQIKLEFFTNMTDSNRLDDEIINYQEIEKK